MDRPLHGSEVHSMEAGLGGWGGRQRREKGRHGHRAAAARAAERKPKDLTRVQHSAGWRSEASISDGMLAVSGAAAAIMINGFLYSQVAPAANHVTAM